MGCPQGFYGQKPPVIDKIGDYTEPVMEGIAFFAYREQIENTFPTYQTMTTVHLEVSPGTKKDVLFPTFSGSPGTTSGLSKTELFYNPVYKGGDFDKEKYTLIYRYYDRKGIPCLL